MNAVLVSLDTVEELFLSQTEADDNGCWLWTGYCDSYGYGRFHTSGQTLQPYRWAYERYVGEIPTGWQVDHLCRVPACVFPGHLEAVTPEENRRRCGRGDGSVTHCIRGHEFTPDNTRIRVDGHRQCLACHRTFGEPGRRGRTSPETVREVRRLHARGGLTFRDIAERLRMHEKTVSRIVNRKGAHST